MAVLEEFATALHALAGRALAPEAVRETRRTILNVVGTAIGASRTPEVDALVRALGAIGKGPVVPLGRDERLDRYGAATVVGFAAHLDDFDDTHLDTVIHPGAATLGAWYALCTPLEPRRALAAFACGVEAQLRVGIAMSPSHYDDGWHITGTCGAIGAAVAAAIALDLDPSGLAAAIGLAAEMPLGHREAFGTSVKAFHAGKAAANGLLAARLAARGLRPTVDCFAQAPGYFGSLAHAHDLTPLTGADLRRGLALLDNTYKPFPCGIVAHPAIEAAIDLHGRLAPDPVGIAGVEVTCNPLVVELMGRSECTSGLEARFCAVHGVAVGLLRGRAGLAEFADATAIDPTIAALRARTRLVPDPGCAREAASLTVMLADGSTRRAHVLHAAGSRERPLSDAALVAKFTDLVEPALPGHAGELVETIGTIGDSTGPEELRVLLARLGEPAVAR